MTEEGPKTDILLWSPILDLENSPIPEMYVYKAKCGQYDDST